MHPDYCSTHEGQLFFWPVFENGEKTLSELLEEKTWVRLCKKNFVLGYCSSPHHRVWCSYKVELKIKPDMFLWERDRWSWCCYCLVHSCFFLILLNLFPRVKSAWTCCSPAAQTWLTALAQWHKGEWNRPLFITQC